MEVYKDESNYEVKFINENVYIKYKDREFWSDIKHIRCGSFTQLKDQNGKKASFNIMKYARDQYNKLIKEKLGKMMVLNKEEVISKFKGIREASEAEKEQYLGYIKRKNKAIDILSNIMGLFFIFIAFCMIGASIKNWLMIFFVIAFGICGYFMRTSRTTKTLLKKIINGKLYIADCHSCELEHRTSSESSDIYYYIKVTDNDGKYINEWFEVDYPSLDDKGETDAKLYVVECNGEYNLDVCTERMLELGKIQNY